MVPGSLGLLLVQASHGLTEAESGVETSPSYGVWALETGWLVAS